jgi:hypothetical protein
LLSRAALSAFISCFILRSLTKWRPFSFHSFSPINCIIILRKPSARVTRRGSPEWMAARRDSNSNNPWF